MSKIVERIAQYRNSFRELLETLDWTALEQGAEAVRQAYRSDKQILTAGNGGSAATAIHFAADFGKNVAAAGEKLPRILTLCGNVSAITALGNDCGYEKVFEGQLRNLMNPGDLVVLISASGNSPNVVLAAEYAKANGATVLGMTGFDGGKLKELADIKLHAPSKNYELVEDVHSFYCHSLVYANKTN